MAPKKLYSKEQMNMALELVQRGSSIASAAKQASAFKKKQTKTKISSVISSQKWQDFNREKQDLKLKTMQEKKSGLY